MHYRIGTIDRRPRRLSVICTIILLLTQLVPQQRAASAPLIQPDDEPPSHVVQRGETLSEIAEFYNIPMAELMQINGISDADAIYVGQELRLPIDIELPTPSPTLRSTFTRLATSTPTRTAPPSPTATSTATPTKTPMPASTPRAHTVQAGETLSAIANAYGASMTEIMRLNGIRDPDAVFAGQTLRLPTSVAITPTPAVDDTARLEDDKQKNLADGKDDERNLNTAAASADSPLAGATQNAGNDSVPDGLTRAVGSLTITLNRRYSVQPGDTLNRIAARMGVALDDLRAINDLTQADGNRLTIGQALILPATTEELRVSAPPQAVATQKYEVQLGDSLSEIAATHDLSLVDLMAANGIDNADAIYIGQQLTIPPKAAADTAGQHAQLRFSPSGYYYYTVKPGDTLSNLAATFNSTQLAILEYNNLPSDGTIFRGLELRIPYGPPRRPLRMPPVPSSGTSFLVSQSRQECWVFHGDRVIRAWQCSTGYGQWTTRIGSFAVQSKIAVAESRAYRLDMPYWLGIYDVGLFENGIHGLPVDWDTDEKIWEGLIGQPATFGCAMLDDTDAADLFAMAFLGMPVHIID